MVCAFQGDGYVMATMTVAIEAMSIQAFAVSTISYENLI
jgi:hypothetical protein